ncbi:MAG: hypothetical protein QME81_05645 [bacterium]|nr:hypothetical protein [bacterium]
MELSLTLGSIIAQRLPTHEARPWRKALTSLNRYKDEDLDSDSPAQKQSGSLALPDVSWPIKAVLYIYPGKRMYGRGEIILWELKLMGEDADHGLFLELLLPAIEEAGSTTNKEWRRQLRLWGHADIDSVYVARGLEWEPLVQEGRLDLRCRPTPTQWAEGETLTMMPPQRLRKIVWLTPFTFDPPRKKPNLQDILKATEARLHQLVPGQRGITSRMEDVFADVKPPWQEVLKQTKQPLRRIDKLNGISAYCPGNWIGSQHFPMIPPALVPYLNLAAILHVGKYTHFGCGTFVLA